MEKKAPIRSFAFWDLIDWSNNLSSNSESGKESKRTIERYFLWEHPQPKTEADFFFKNTLI